MKNKITYLLAFVLFLTSCQSVRVAVDYDKSAQFKSFKTFGFLKEGIDRAEINDLDKRRILRSIETVLIEKGFTMSETPDLIVNFFTKERQQVNIYNNNRFNYFGGMGYGWGPFMGSQVNVLSSQQGTLFIDIIETNNKELIWQGVGKGSLTARVNKKEELIHSFVTSILENYPPEINAKP
ncbi:DUF4136 domain-containing protein [Flavobacteriaceae bacterium]|nr:DUF4136 domain-containing protein [Flavobacteriaceae bacterium]